MAGGEAYFNKLFGREIVMYYLDACKCQACVANKIEVAEKEINKANARKPIDWNKPLQIITNHGTFEVINLGLGWKDKRIVQIEECSARFPSHDGGLPNVFVPDDSGYVVQFDRWIENVPEVRIIEIDVVDKGYVRIKRNGLIVHED